jgi:hypothetical protein
VSPESTAKLLARIRDKNNTPGMPILDGLEFVRHVRERRWDDDYAWQVYLSHDPCHDSYRGVSDRWTVVAFSRRTCEYRVIGRELSRNYAFKLAKGDL